MGTNTCTTNTCTITIHMVSSLDGFIAKKDNSIDWFNTQDHYAKGIEYTPEQTAAFLKSVGCYIMGAHTYEHACALSKSYGWAYGDTPTIVVTNRQLAVERKNIELYSGDLAALVNNKIRPLYKSAWMVGGAMLTKEFLRLQLADEIRLSVLPVLLGAGLPFFDHIEMQQALHLENITAFKSGMAELHYSIKK